MRITIEHEDGSKVEYRQVTDFAVMVRCLEGGLVTKDHSETCGDLGWLTGKLYLTLQYVKHAMFNTPKKENEDADPKGVRRKPELVVQRGRGKPQ